MNIPEISREIVKKRQEKAPFLKEMADTCQDYRKSLEEITAVMRDLSELDTPEMRKSREDISNLVSDLTELISRIQIRYNRFSHGLITVSIAGLEKAGKTTFLRSLTGIDTLPAFDERCTAVCCEIHYAADRSDFDMEFYSESEFLDRVIKPLIETVSADIPESFRAGFNPPASASDFISLRIPPADVLAGGTTAYKLLCDLQILQRHFNECRQNLGNAPMVHRPLEELKEWVSYRQSGNGNDEKIDRGRHLARVSAAKVCRIYTNFKGGSSHLRWVDTPGVDDPNRRARDLTLSTIANETDILVVASRPGSNPTPNESFHRFWDSVSRQPDEIDLMNRMLFILNCDRRVDPNGENINIHRKYLIDAGVPQHLFIGPFEAIRKEDAIELMNRVNAHLSEHLSNQDDLVIRELRSRLKNIQARIRLLHDTLIKSHPSDSGQQDLEAEEFYRWFHWYHADRDTGFWTDLVEALDRSTRAIADDPRIHDYEKALNSIFAESAKDIQSKIPSAKELEDYVIRHRGENPIPHGMRTISTYFSGLINLLSNEIRDFGPIMQDEIVDVLTRAGLGPLLIGKISADKLKFLLENFDSKKSGSPIVEVLRETLDLPRNLKYVLRYELRGAVDFCDPTLWDEKEQAWKRLVDMVTANTGDIERLAKFDTNKHTPVTDSREQDSQILKKIAANAMLGIHAVLNNERHLPRRIADDFMRDCRVRLCFGPDAEQEWRILLFRSRSILLAQTISQIRAKSERVRAFNTALRNLEIKLP